MALTVSSGLVLNTYLTLAAAPTTGVDEVVTLTTTGTVSGGTFTLTFGGQTTTAIAYNATAATVSTALQALSTIGSANVTCAGGPLPSTGVTIQFTGILSGTNVGAMSSTDSLTGSTPATVLTVTTAGVQGSYRGAPANSVLMRTDGVGFLYVNTNTSQRPVWTEQS